MEVLPVTGTRGLHRRLRRLRRHRRHRRCVHRRLRRHRRCRRRRHPRHCSSRRLVSRAIEIGENQVDEVSSRKERERVADRKICCSR